MPPTTGSPDLLIRPARTDDATVIADFNTAMALETEHKCLDPATLRAGVEHAVANPQIARYFLAESAGQVVGQLMVTMEWSDWRNGTFWWIQSVYVHPEHRSRGVFKALYRHVEQLARDRRDVCGLRLYVEKENGPAQQVYRKLGMRDAGYVVYEIDWTP
jgi:ribosomal protein S18 acetylase RimI-like enzyme